MLSSQLLEFPSAPNLLSAPQQPCPLPALLLLFSCLNPICWFLVAWFLVFSGDSCFQLLDGVYIKTFLLTLHLFSKTSDSTQKIVFLWVLVEGKVQGMLSRLATWWTLHEKSFVFNHPFPHHMPLVSRCWEFNVCLRVFFSVQIICRGWWFILVFLNKSLHLCALLDGAV